jgi:hypothetical protein
MARLIGALAIIFGLADLQPVAAQFVVGPVCAPGLTGGFGYSYSFRSGFGFAIGGPRVRIGGIAGGFVSRSLVVSPPLIGVTPVNPWWGGWGPLGVFSPFAPPAVAVPVPVVVPVPAPVIDWGGERSERPSPEPIGNAPPRPDPPPVLRPVGDFIVIAPRREETVPPVERVEPPPIPLPLPPPDPFRRPPPVKAEAVEADPLKEAYRLVRLGREAFMAGEFGRAAEQFEQAIRLKPAEAWPHFLLAQAQFAAGLYTDAVRAIQAGLDRDPTWPTAPFDPARLYGEKPERFVLHLMALKKALADNPGNATLEFLLGYQLWFSGEKDEATKLFRAAEKRLPAPGPIALFK